MRSFVGPYKVLARVIPQCSSLLAALDAVVARRQSHERIECTSDLLTSFWHAQLALSSSRTITLPRASDQLWIITDGVAKPPGISATLYVSRNNKLLLSGVFSVKLRGRQVSWLPCEIEALSIIAATKHFSPYIIQSKTPTCILTESKHVSKHLRSSAVASIFKSSRRYFFFSELIGTKHLFIMLLERPSYRLTLVVAIPLNMTVQLAKYAPLLKAQRIPWYFSPPCKVYSPVQLSSLSLAGPLGWSSSLSAPI